MRIDFVDYLVCPSCQGSLTFVGESKGNHIEEGTLACQQCGIDYPIRGGVPRFPINDTQKTKGETLHTQRTYNFTWRHFGLQELTQGWEKDSYQYVETIPISLISGNTKVGIEAGCGGGADLVRIAANGATIIGVDLSEGVETAYKATRHLANVCIVQADIHYLPFPPYTFDFIYSFGVLHHLPDPQNGLMNLTRLLRADCPLITYLYEDFEDRSRFERGLLTTITSIRKLTTQFPPRLLYICCWLLVPFIWLLCAVPAASIFNRDQGFCCSIRENVKRSSPKFVK